MTQLTVTQSDNYPRLSEVQQLILRRIVEGESVISICKAEAMPSKSTVFKWLNESEAFRTGYHLAKALYAETLFEEALEIVDEPPPMITDADGNRRVDPGAVQHAKLRLDARKWACGKLNPRRFGDSSTLNLNDVSERETAPRTREEMFARLAKSVSDRAKEGQGDDD